MKFFFKSIFLLTSNFFALAIADYFIAGFNIQPNWQAYLKVTVIFTLANLVIKPILKVIFSPLIFITLGLGLVIVNALLLYGLDWFLDDLSISGLYSLIYATLIIGLTNFLFHFSAKKAYQD